ncbi:hypothetical protein [Lentzea kentuckyensis]|uniref:hypothetical protein n=1 Tax=Lentzea kentuckyensis TaxID=360086 RepID=UPI000A3C344E|nr:hypothetical protein [Lentzea kentuckyensis]
MVAVTAKVKCTNKTPSFRDQQTLWFAPNYDDDRNKEWAEATPTLSLQMVVKGSVAEHFKPGNAYTLTFTPDQ